MIMTLAGRHPARLGLGLLGVGILVLALVPTFASSYYTSVLGEALAFSIFAISLDLMWGISGVLSFGHAAFFGIGAYAFGLLTQDLSGGSATYIAVIAALVIPGLFGAGLGYFTFFSGVSGPYFAIITLTVALILGQAATSFPHFTGGLNGLYTTGLVFQVPGGEIVPVRKRRPRLASDPGCIASAGRSVQALRPVGDTCHPANRRFSLAGRRAAQRCWKRSHSHVDLAG